MKKHLFYLLPLLLWMGLIFYLSGHAGANDNSLPLIARLLERVVPGIWGHLTAQNIEDMNFVFRKTAHITEYFVLTFWAFRALQYGKPRITLKNIAMGMVIAVLYACTDEIHQAFVPHRSSSFNDVMIDSIGTALACGIVLVWKGHQHLVRALFSSPPTDNHT